MAWHQKDTIIVDDSEYHMFNMNQEPIFVCHCLHCVIVLVVIVIIVIVGALSLIRCLQFEPELYVPPSMTLPTDGPSLCPAPMSLLPGRQ